MKLRTKTILFFGISFLVTALLVAIFGEVIIGAAFRKEVTNDVRIFAEQSEGAYFNFLEKKKARAVDWAGDGALVDIVEKILRSQEGSKGRSDAQRAFVDYLVERRIPLDKTVFEVDLIGRDGEVIVSTGTTHADWEEYTHTTIRNTSYFSKAITSEVPEAFVGSIVFEERDGIEPLSRVATRIFSKKGNGEFIPLDAVLVVHFFGGAEIAKVLSGEAQIESGEKTGRALMESYDTSEIYLVNAAKLMVTPSRYVHNITERHTVDTFPVRECLLNGEEVAAEYYNYHGIRVLGASMCFFEDGLVLLVEVDKNEILLPLTRLMYTSAAVGVVLLILGFGAILFFVRPPLRRVDEIVNALERVIKGDLDVSVKVNSRDETGRLAEMFNAMIASIRNSQKEIENSRRLVEEKASFLERDIEEHQKQEKFLEESKRATLNLLEDSWKAKEKLEEEGNKLQTILASIGDALILIGFDYKVMLVNAKALEMFNCSREEMLGKDLRTLVKFYKKKAYVNTSEWPTEEMFRTHKSFVSTLEDGFYILPHKKEMQIPVTVSISPIGGKFAGGVIVIRDVTQDQVLNEAKSSFISVASHQLRTPLTSIRWYSEMLLSEDAGRLTDTQRDFMNEIHGGAERLYQTVDLLLGISRIENGKVRMSKNVVGLDSFTKEIIKELSLQIEEKGLTFEIKQEEGAPVAVWLDAIVLRQVVLNLASNAIRYTPKGGAVNISWWVNPENKEVTYAVRDNGIGIPDSQKNRIFSKFFRAENARNAVPDGSGLGLVLVKDLVEAWGGKVWFESREGEGSTFFFTIPVAVVTTTV